jgi:large conductance mechanosensitive channel
MKKLFGEFKKFINKGNALSLAIGVILGAAFTSIVTTINTKIISPLIGLLLGDTDLSNSLVTVLKSTTDSETGEVVITNAIYWGSLIQAIIDFLLTALILFAIFKIASKFSDTVKKIQDKEALVNYKLQRKIKLTKKEKAIAEKMAKEKEEQAKREEEEKNKIPEPTFEEKQLALLQSINNNLMKLNEINDKVRV